MQGTLLERDTELAELGRVATDVVGGRGAVALLEGPAGIGKTALLEAVRAGAEREGIRIVHARASELDRSYGFGVVHQLFEPALVAASQEERDELLGGAAARAEIVFSTGVESAGESEYAVLHGLYWLLFNLAARAPLLLVVDDLQWADSPSLRFLEYAGRRLEELPVGVLGSLRPGEPGAASELIDALATGPVAGVIRPAALSGDAARALLEDALGVPPADEFSRAATTATGGNPLLLSTLAREASALGLRGSTDEAPALTAIAARGVAPAVERRLRSLGREAVELARAAAVAGERGRVEEVAALAGTSVAEARAGLEQLAAVRVLHPGGWTFVHPLVRAAVVGSIPHSRRMELHSGAATQLRVRGAKPAEVAAHLMVVEPTGDPGTIVTLREAARAVTAEGAPDIGVAYLRRALAEPLSADDRPVVLLELGELEARVGAPDAVGRLRAAIDSGLSGDDLARAYAVIGNHRLHSDPGGALEDLERAFAEASDPALRLRLEALVLETAVFLRSLAKRRLDMLDQGRRATDPSPVMLAHLAQHAGYPGSPATQTLELARRALEGGDLLRNVGPGTSTWNLLVHAVRYAEDAQRSRQMIAEGEAIVRRQGFRFASFFIDHAWAYWHLDFGSVATAAAHARTGLELVREAGLDVTVGALAAIAAEALIESDDLDEAAKLFDAPMDAVVDTVAEPFALSARGMVRYLQRDVEAAEADFRHVLQLLEERGWHAPLVTEARTRLAWLPAARGDRDEAQEHVDSAVARATLAGTPGALGAALRAQARLVDADDSVAVLREAARVLEGTDRGLLRAAALADLGAVLRRRGNRRESREPLRLALDLATRAESARLVKRTRDELAASGAHPRRESLSGVAALTPSERRVADMAAGGLTNRQIAESLWVTQKTVEVHLGHAYGKLRIKSRSQLPEALGADVRTAVAA